MKCWEDMIALNNFVQPVFDTLPAPREFYVPETLAAAGMRDFIQHVDKALVSSALEKDDYPLPLTRNREGYWGDDHLGYWLSGLRDYKILTECCARLGVSPSSYLDFGCASGRVIRHFAVNSPEIAVYGCDINRSHVDWVRRYLSPSILVFQTHSIPTLPLPDNTLDLVSAYSVFTHIEAFETTWLMELRRILKSGGLVWVTVNSEKTWEEMGEGWPVYRLLCNYPGFPTQKPRPAMEEDRLVLRRVGDASYSSQVFYRFDYIKDVWGRFFEIVEIHRRLPGFQDVIVLRKT